MADEEAVLDLEGEGVLDRHRDQRAAQLRRVDAARHPAHDLRAGDFVAVKGRAEIEDGTRLRAPDDHRGNLDPAAVGELHGTKTGPGAGAAFER